MSKRGWYLVITMALIVVAGLAGITHYWANQPAESVVNAQSTTTQPIAAISAPTPLTTDYFSTALPAGYVTQTITEKTTNPQLLQIMATTTDNNRYQLAITIGRLSADGITGIADYNYRLSSQEIYQRVSYNWLPDKAIAFTKKVGNSETTVIWPQDDRYAIVAISGGQYNTFNTTLETVFNNWRWL
jgi:hypothetical protein